MSHPRLSIIIAGWLSLLASEAWAQAVAFQPVVGSFPNGATMSVTPVVSADRRYVRLTVNPQFTNLLGLDPFSVPAAVGGGGINGGIGGGLGGVGGGGLGGAVGGGLGGRAASLLLSPDANADGAAAMARKAFAARAVGPQAVASSAKSNRPQPFEIKNDRPAATTKKSRPRTVIQP